jgi:hypothetical protein
VRGITLYIDNDPVTDRIELAEAYQPIEESFAEGKPVKIIGANTGTTLIRDLQIGLAGEGANNVQLAIDREDSPGVWASEGQGIYAADMLRPGDRFSFWSRGMFSMDDMEGERTFEFVFKGTSIGAD